MRNVSHDKEGQLKLSFLFCAQPTRTATCLFCRIAVIFVANRAILCTRICFKCLKCMEYLEKIYKYFSMFLDIMHIFVQ
ncbi:MAG TPA: hypothetical protein DEW37_08835 [Oscillibacter sp.]|nr:hypothetical protein [Oscillibacter sp.]